MPRRSTGPRYYASKKAWFATINKETIKLAEGKRKATEQLAKDKYDKLAKVRSVEVQGDRAETGVILNEYLNQMRTRGITAPIAPSTYRIKHDCIKDFCNFEFEPGRKLGTLPYRELKMKHIEQWLHVRKTEGKLSGLKKRPVTWSDTYVNLQLRVLRTAFIWASAEGGLVSESVFARNGKKVRIKKPDASITGLAVNDEEHQILVKQARRRKHGNFADFLELLYHTGARPAEVYLTQPEEWKPDLEAIVIDPKKPTNVGRLKNLRWLKSKNRKRTIRIPNHLLPIMDRLVKNAAQGYLFTKERGGIWDNKSIADRMKGLVKAANKKAGSVVVRKEITLYSYRHGYVTRWLKLGNNPTTLAELLNTSLKMIEDHYSHLFEEHGILQQEINQFAKATLNNSPEHNLQSSSPSEDSLQEAS